MDFGMKAVLVGLMKIIKNRAKSVTLTQHKFLFFFTLITTKFTVLCAVKKIPLGNLAFWYNSSLSFFYFPFSPFNYCLIWGIRLNTETAENKNKTLQHVSLCYTYTHIHYCHLKCILMETNKIACFIFSRVFSRLSYHFIFCITFVKREAYKKEAQNILLCFVYHIQIFEEDFDKEENLPFLHSLNSCSYISPLLLAILLSKAQKYR